MSAGDIWIVIDDSTGAMVSGPFDDEPEIEEGQIAVLQPPGYITDWVWDPVHRGRKDVVSTAPLISIAAFMLLLTQEERLSINALRRSGTTEGYMVDDFWALLQGCIFGLSLQHPMVIAGVNFLHTIGAIEEGRAEEILAGQLPS